MVDAAAVSSLPVATPRRSLRADETVMRFARAGERRPSTTDLTPAVGAKMVARGENYEFTIPELSEAAFGRLKACVFEKLEELVAVHVSDVFRNFFEPRLSALEQRIEQKIDRLIASQSGGAAAYPQFTPSQLAPAFTPNATLAGGVPVDAGVQQRMLFASVLKQAPLLEKKSRFAVVEKLPEMEGEEADAEYVSKVVGQAAQKIDAGAEILRVFRHNGRPVTANQPDRPRRPRIVKVEFGSTTHRDAFIAGFRRALDDPERKLRPSVFARRDMIPYELALQSELRQKCYGLNKDAGEIRYYYRDLKILPCRPAEDGSFRRFTNQPPGSVEMR